MLLLAFLSCCLYFSLPSEVLEHLHLVLLALVVVVEVDLLQVRGPGDRRVEPLPSDVRELVVEDGDGLVDVASLEGVAGPAVVVYEVLLDLMDGERHRVAQRDHLPLHRRDIVFVVHVQDLLLELEPRPAYERLACFVRLFLLEQSRSDLRADHLTGGVPL